MNKVNGVFKRSCISLTVFQSISLSCVQAATITVNSNGDVSAQDALCTFREAIIAANNNNPAEASGCIAGDDGMDTLVFAPSVFNSSITGAPATITLTQDESNRITDDISISGPGEDQLEIITDTPGSSIGRRLLESLDAAAQEINISDVTISGSSVLGNGGALYVRNLDQLNLERVTITRNTVNNNGGAIFVGQAATATIRNSSISENTSLRGGAIASSGDGINGALPRLEIIDSVISSNSANIAGAIYISDTVSLIVDGGSIANNTATSSNGGAINSRDNTYVTLQNTDISYNTSSSFGGGINLDENARLNSSNTTWKSNQSSSSGGAISFTSFGSGNKGMATIDGDTFHSNSAGFFGGAIGSPNYSVFEMTINNSSLYENTATNSGGGALGVAANGTITVSNSTINSNSAVGQSVSGGGIFSQGDLNLENTTISANFANGRGGGVSVSNRSSIANSTISANSAVTSGGGLYIQGAASLINSIVAGNLSDGLGREVSENGATFDLLTTNIFGSSEVTQAEAFAGFSPASNDLDLTSDGGTTSVPLSAIIGDLSDNGGPTLTYALIENSPAINAGNVAFCSANQILLDQRGEERDNNCDIGSFETFMEDDNSFFVIPISGGRSVVVPL